MNKLQMKSEQLREALREMGSVAVAFSGGVDSTFLLKEAHDLLGDNAVAITAESDFFSDREFAEAEAFCKREGIRQLLVPIELSEIVGFADNPPNRCYHCKRFLFRRMLEITGEEGIPYLVDGSNADDNMDYRPGMEAVRELGIKSPLLDVGLCKQEIRELSKIKKLPTFDRPSAACLASRFAFGETITKEGLARVEQAEAYLKTQGFSGCRVRVHGSLARIEVSPEDIDRLAAKELREDITKNLKETGFTYVTLDLAGYRTGSMNETLFSLA